MRPLFATILMVLVVLGCKKSSTENTSNRKFAPGDVVVGIQGAVQLEALFAYVNAYNLKIDRISGYSYTTTIPQDSIAYIRAVLNTKPYIKTRNFSASVWPHYQTGIVHNTTMLWDMTPPNQRDYIQTKNALRMTDELLPTKDMLLKVPVGEEADWRATFASLPWVRWADLNWISDIVGG